MPTVVRIAGLVLAGVVLARAAAAGPVKLEVVPSKLELCEFERGAPLVVNLDNSGAAALEAVEIQTAGGSAIRLDDCKLGALPAATAQACDTIARCTAAPCVAGPVYVRASYRQANQRWLAATASVEIVQPSVAMAGIATMSARPSRAEIAENSPGIAYLSITNLSPYELTLTLAFHDANTSRGRPVVALVGTPPSAKIPAFAAATLPFGMTMLALGKDTVAIDATVTWNDGKCSRSGALSAAFDIETGSTELAMLLKLLGLPALLLLPGALLLSASAILWQFGLALQHPRAAKSEFWFAYASPYFWVLAICVSFVWYRLYAWQHTDLRDTYRLGDVIALWSLSLLIGAALHVLAFAVIRLIVWSSDRRSAARTPRVDDGPWTTLNKLALRRGLLNLPKAGFGSPQRTAFILEEDHDKLWLCPAITYRPPSDDKRANDIVAMRDAGDLDALVALFKPDPRALQWAESGGPRLVEAKDVQRLKPRSILTAAVADPAAADHRGPVRDEPGS